MVTMRPHTTQKNAWSFTTFPCAVPHLKDKMYAVPGTPPETRWRICILFDDREGDPARIACGFGSVPEKTVDVTVGVPVRVSEVGESRAVKSIPRTRDSVLYWGSCWSGWSVFDGI